MTDAPQLLTRYRPSPFFGIDATCIAISMGSAPSAKYFSSPRIIFSFKARQARQGVAMHLENDPLAALWMPFTANRAFKAMPRC